MKRAARRASLLPVSWLLLCFLHGYCWVLINRIELLLLQLLAYCVGLLYVGLHYLYKTMSMLAIVFRGQFISYSQILPNSLLQPVFVVTGLGNPKFCETSRIPHCIDNRIAEGGEVVSLTLRSPFTPRKSPGTNLC
jgi:hypothetical protein